jgi:hypothetical protein
MTNASSTTTSMWPPPMCGGVTLSLLSDEERLMASRFEIASMQPLMAFGCLLHQVRGALARRRGGAAPALL